jgi:Fuc2NAc and GlcNAc transferase
MQESVLDAIMIMIPVVLLSWSGTGLIYRFALSRSILDYPDDRSSHNLPTATGGGSAIAVAFYLGLIFLIHTDVVGLSEIQLLFAGIVLVVIGIVDDLKTLDFRWRIAVHFSVGIFTGISLKDMPDIQIADIHINLHFLAIPVTALALVWATNLYNFMDGIDGLAGSECCFITLAAAGFLAAAGDAPLAIVSLVLSAASAGFLIWNWPPARIFMGDSGSGFLGFTIGSIAFLSIYSGSMSLWTWVLLPGAFIADATLTVTRRIFSGERWYQAHCTHAYQHMARVFGHKKVVLGFLGINLFWLLPLAWFAEKYPEYAAYSAVFGIVPLCLLAWWAGAGRSEIQVRNNN